MLDTATTQARDAHKRAGILSLTGAGLMLFGAGIWASTGTDVDVALATGTMQTYLTEVAAARAAKVANLSIWIVGVLGLGAAGTAMAGVGRGRPWLREFAKLAYWVAVPVAIVAFVAWMAVVVHASASPSPTEVAIAEVVAWFAYRADGVATALIVGAGPALLSAAGRREWVPEWLFVWGIAAAAVGVLSFLPYYVAAIPVGLALVIVPVGIGWTIAAGIVLVRTRSALR